MPCTVARRTVRSTQRLAWTAAKRLSMPRIATAGVGGGWAAAVICKARRPPFVQHAGALLLEEGWEESSNELEPPSRREAGGSGALSHAGQRPASGQRDNLLLERTQSTQREGAAGCV